MGVRELAITKASEADALERLVRALSASGNVAVLGLLVEARRADPRDGWLYLSDIAARVNESPGSISMGLQKLLPLLEEKRVKGRRYFRSRVRSLRVVLDIDEAPKGPF